MYILFIQLFSWLLLDHDVAEKNSDLCHSDNLCIMGTNNHVLVLNVCRNRKIQFLTARSLLGWKINVVGKGGLQSPRGLNSYPKSIGVQEASESGRSEFIPGLSLSSYVSRFSHGIALRKMIQVQLLATLTRTR